MFFFFQAEDGIRDLVRSRGLGDVYKRQVVDQKLDKSETGVGAEEALTLRCIELLQAGDVKTFNEVRPLSLIHI